MEEILKCPEIINPYHLDEHGYADKVFVEHIGLDHLLSAVPFHCLDTRKFALKVLVDFVTDMGTAKYRQDVFDELISNGNLRDKVCANVRDIYQVEYNRIKYRNTPNLLNGLEMLRRYKYFIDNHRDISSASSKALTKVHAYCSKLKRSDMFGRLSDFINKTQNYEGVDFKVSLDKNYSPLMISALELVERKSEKKPRLSLFEKLFSKKKEQEGQSLRSAGKLNELGRLIQSYLEQEFTPIFRTYSGHIEALTELLEPLDFYAGFSEYFAQLKKMKFEICRPSLFGKREKKLSVKNARNPLLIDKRRIIPNKSPRTSFITKAEDLSKKVVPNDINYNSEKNMFVITGPNNGGKSTYVKTVGLIHLLSQKGLPVTAQSAEVSFVDGIYTHFVAPDDITQGDGRYRNELKRMKEIIEKATPYSLVILDEPCGGTSYEEGCRQSLVLLDGFHRLGVAVYFTTHMHPIAEYVDNGRYTAASNLAVECIYADNKMTYTYKVTQGASGKSYGQEIAKEIGLMPENISEMVSQKAMKYGYGKKLRR